MATIKSNTDVSQSRKLAEFLPLGSADMFCADVFNKEKETHTYNFHILSTWGCNTFEELHDRENKFLCFIPVWSLTALFGIMPQINDWITPHGHKNDKLSQFEPKICKIWKHSIIPSYKVTYDNGLSTDIYDNPVDACVDMILKLHELGLL